MNKPFPKPSGLRNNIGKGPIKVIQIDIETNKTVGVFSSETKAAEKTRIYQASISNCINKKQKTAGGYRWEVLKLAE